MATLGLVVLGPVLAFATYLVLGPMDEGASSPALRAILLECPLDEAFKWRGPVYCAHGGNVAILWGFKAHCALGFFKGVLLEDPQGLLVAPGPNSRAARMIPFADPAEVQARAADIRDYVGRAIAIEKTGR